MDMRGIPFNQLNETMTTLTSGNGTAFKVEGAGVVSALITCPDTTSAVGTFAFQVGDTETGNFSTLSVPTLAKSAGTALTAVQIVLSEPGSRWCRLYYTRTSGGAAAEATIAITVS